ncbi:hypothetical protein [Streptomyces sp. Ru73]|nr:hypothetical protein [Streptomyces sp. Ru73]
MAAEPVHGLFGSLDRRGERRAATTAIAGPMPRLPPDMSKVRPARLSR